ncbi:hypothetical protein X474_05845 [Dethiosulfatarculus sandiegensis]|uniref:Uncharacterized protein n=1 Tax=Dethiosulfatarculus sandiegensis TaxID=1429043 RepID=A0A0D2JZX2_9BACT|nr:hypothetical protein X474_05845 [Dethiosulfatarculus sandiegensis]
MVTDQKGADSKNPLAPANRTRAVSIKAPLIQKIPAASPLNNARAAFSKDLQIKRKVQPLVFQYAPERAVRPRLRFKKTGQILPMEQSA